METQITRLSEKRMKIVHGGKTYYVRQIVAPRERTDYVAPGENFIEPGTGVYEVAFGDETTRSEQCSSPESAFFDAVVSRGILGPPARKKPMYPGMTNCVIPNWGAPAQASGPVIGGPP